MSTHQGKEKYIFVSYAPMDSEKVLPMITIMELAGFCVRYHTNTEEEYSFSVDKNLENSEMVLAFVSPNTIDSVTAKKEINYVLQNQREILVAYLEDINSQYGLGKQLNAWVALHRSHYATESGFLCEILKAPTLQEYKKRINESLSSSKAQVYTPSQQCKVGDIIRLGAYCQNGTEKEAIEWQVLDIYDGQALVISKYALDCKCYANIWGETMWETCTLRKWLNREFLNSAFSDSEKAKILSVKVSADKNPKYGIDPGKSTQDRIFLLSIPEAQKYFGDDKGRECKPTAFAIANGVNVNSSNGNCWWWLRSPGRNRSNVASVYDFGGIGNYGYGAYSNIGGVRPAFWMNLNS